MDIELFMTSPGIRFDLGFSGGDLASEHDIKTAVMVSLFTDRRAEEDDPLPDNAASKRGWWGDALNGVGKGRRIGSRFWLLTREKQLKDVLIRAREYAKESLQWLIEDGVAQEIIVDAEILKPDVLGLVVDVRRERQTPARYRFEFAWNNINQVRK